MLNEEKLLAEINEENVVTPTTEESVDVLNGLNASSEEAKELSDEEMEKMYIDTLKKSKIKFKNTTHKGNITITKFGSDYRKKRQRKNKQTKASRKANRK